VVSPAIEWHTGFPYSPLTEDRRYDGVPNRAKFPDFVSLDLLTYKTFDIKHHAVDLGVQLFNATSHFNPRDVMPIGASSAAPFANSLGIRVEGYMMVNWE
jgi:hypothetical protein